MAETPETILIKVELQGVDKSKKELQALKDETQRLALETKDLQTELKKVGEQQGKNSDAYKELSKQVEVNQTKIAQNRRVQLEYSIAIRETAQRQKEATQAAKEAAKQDVIQEGSLNALRKRLSDVVKERNNLNRADAEGAKRYAVLSQEAKKLTDELKKEEAAIGDTRRNVGNYEEAIKSALGAQGGFITQLQGLQGQLRAIQSGLLGVTKGLKAVVGGLAATGIGALIAVLGLLVSAFLSTEEGANALSDSIDGIKIGFKSLMQGIDDFRKRAAEGIGRFFTNAKDVFSSFGELLSSATTLDATKIKAAYDKLGAATSKLYEDAVKDAKAAGEAITQAFVEGVESVSVATKLKDALRQVEKAKIALSVQNAKDLVQLEKLKKVGDDVSQSEQARVDARVEANKLLTDATGKELGLLQRQLYLTKQLNGLTDDSAEKRQQEADLAIQIAALESRLLSEQQDGVNAISNIRREAFNARLSQLRALETAEQNLSSLQNKGGEDTIKREIDRINLILSSETIANDERIKLIQARGIAEKDLVTATIEGQREILEAKLKQLQEEQRLQEEYSAKGVIISQEDINARKAQADLLTEQLAQLQAGASIQYVQVTDKTQKEVLAIEQQSAIQSNAIQQQKTDNALGVASQLLGGLAAVSEKSFELNKAFQLAAATVDGVRAVISAFANTPGEITIKTSAAIAAGLFSAAQIAKIAASQPPSAGGGGGGSSSSVSSVAVNTRTSSATLANGASQGNLTANQIANTLSKQPAPIVRVADINNAQGRVSVKDSVRKL